MDSIETLLFEEDQEVFLTKYKQLLDSCEIKEDLNFIKNCFFYKLYGGSSIDKPLTKFKALPSQNKFAGLSLKTEID